MAIHRIVALSLVALACTPTPSASALPSATSSATSAPTATAPTPVTARPTPLALSGTIAVRATKVPTEFRYLPGAELPIARIWLADLVSGSVVDVLAARTDSHLEPNFSASADGRRLAAGVGGPNGRGAVYLVDVEAGSATLVYEDPEIQASLVPAISPDGSRIAFAASDGVHMVDATTRASIRIVPHDDPRSIGGLWSAIAWSADAKWLAIARGSEGSSELAIVDTGRETRRVGVGSLATWRSAAPELLVMDTASAFGGRSQSYTYDVATNRGTSLEITGNQRRASLAWHPSEDRFLYVAALSPIAVGDVFVRRLADQTPAKVSAPRSVVDAWWSRDGSKIYALLVREDALRDAIGDANYELAEIPAGSVLATVCRGDPRAVCP